MNRFITYKELRKFAYSNDELIKGKIEGVVFEFTGASICQMYHEHTIRGKFYASRNVLYVIPYYNPWAYMNAPAVKFVDEICDVLFEHYGLSENTPIASTGGSMGGLGAILYTARGKRTPKICVANCPVCDLVFQVKNKVNTPRSAYSAFFYEEGDFLDVLKKYSPIDIIDELPKETEYFLFHGDNDEAVNYTAHSKRMYEKMLEKGYNVRFTLCKGRSHSQVLIDSDVPQKENILRCFGLDFSGVYNEYTDSDRLV